MRLTSYNIAVTVIKAQCCLARYVERMWGYIEEGDDEKIECAYEKALQLSFLIDTLSRWKPTIASGKRVSITATITSGTFPIPFLSSGTFIDGIRISDPFTVMSGDNSDVVSGISAATNCYISPDNDLIILESLSSSGESLQASLLVDDSIDTAVLSSVRASPKVSWTISSVITEDVTSTPHCLTDEQVLSIVEKIQKLCTCGC